MSDCEHANGSLINVLPQNLETFSNLKDGKEELGRISKL